MGLLDPAGGAALNAAVAGLGKLAAVLLDDAQTGSVAERAGIGGDEWGGGCHRLQYRRNGDVGRRIGRDESK